MTNPNDPAAGSAPQPPPPPPPAPMGAPPPPAAPAPHAGPSGPDAAAKLEEAMAGLTKNFSTPELLAGGGALLILAVYVVFGVLLDTFFPSDVVFATAALLLLVIVGQRMGLIDFGSSQRSLIILLGFVLGSLLIYSFLAYFRSGSNAVYLFGGSNVIGLILDWVGEAAAAAGAFLTWRVKKA